MLSAYIRIMNKDQNPWTILDQKEIYENPWIKLTEFRVLNPAGGQGIYGKVHFNNFAVGVIPLDAEMNTWLVGQYRFPLGQYSWEIPEGGGSLLEDPDRGSQKRAARGDRPGGRGMDRNSEYVFIQFCYR